MFNQSHDEIIKATGYFSNGMIYPSRYDALEDSDPQAVPSIVPVEIFGKEVRCPLSNALITIWTDKPSDWSKPIIFEPEVCRMITTNKGRLVSDDNGNYFYLDENDQVGAIASREEWIAAVKDAGSTLFFVKASAIGVYDAEAEAQEEAYWRRVAEEEAFADFMDLMEDYRAEVFWAIMDDPDASEEDRLAARNELILMGELDPAELNQSYVEAEIDYDEGLF